MIVVTGLKRAVADVGYLTNFLIWQSQVLTFATLAFYFIRLDLKRSRRLLPFGIYVSRRVYESAGGQIFPCLIIYSCYVILWTLGLVIDGEQKMRIPLANNNTLYATFAGSNRTMLDHSNWFDLYVFIFGLGILYMPLFVRLFLYRSRRFGELKPRGLAAADEIHTDEHLFKFDGLHTLRRM